jgi:NADH-quinone oxidoreductase subunit N
MKRLLAWSSIAHAGYMLCGLSLLVANGSDLVKDGTNLPVQAILIYLTVYLFMNLGAFLVAGLIFRASGSEQIHDYAGMSRRNPMLALAMAVFMFSLVGLPPFAGFIAKLNLMWRLGENGGWWWSLVAVIGANTVFSLYYYARVVRAMYLKDSDEPKLEANPVGVGLALACAMVLFVLLVGFGPFDKMTAAASRMADDAPSVMSDR